MKSLLDKDAVVLVKGSRFMAMDTVVKMITELGNTRHVALLADYLTQCFTVFGVVKYLTFRGILGALTALGLSLVLGPMMIRRLNLLQIGQSVRNDGPQSHLSKSGTPTMGGTH